MARKQFVPGTVNMTPMIDVVFQLIIFFILTLKMDTMVNEDIILETSPHGPAVDPDERTTVTIEVDRVGRLSLNGRPVTRQQLYNLIRGRYQRQGSRFPVIIRADYRTLHKDVRQVMDICAGIGIWRVNFAAVKEHRRSKGRHMGIR